MRPRTRSRRASHGRALIALLGATAAGAGTGCVLPPALDLHEAPCDERWVYPDADGDGFGDAEDAGERACESVEGTVENALDCDDADALTTARTAALCPGELAGENTSYTSVANGTEFVAVHADNATVSAVEAESACGETGWGGWLATFRDEAQLGLILDALAEDDVWAGFVGYAPDEEAWGYYGPDSTWFADAGQVLPLTSASFCAGTIDAYRGRDLRYLALVRDRPDDALAAWCLGTPDEAVPQSGSEVPYAIGAGHFVCERPPPDPAALRAAP